MTEWCVAGCYGSNCVAIRLLLLAHEQVCRVNRGRIVVLQAWHCRFCKIFSFDFDGSDRCGLLQMLFDLKTVCIKLSLNLGALRFLIAPLFQLTGPCHVPCLQGSFVSRLDFDLRCGEMGGFNCERAER